MFFPVPYFTPKLFCFFCLWLLICLCSLFAYLLVELSFVILKSSAFFVLFDPVNCFEPFFFRYYLLTYFFQLYCQTYLWLFFLRSFFSVEVLYVSPSLIVSYVVAGSLFGFLTTFPVQISYFYSDSFWLYLFYYWLLWLLYRLTRSVQWCGMCPLGVMVKALTYRIVVREFKIQSRYYGHFWTNSL